MTASGIYQPMFVPGALASASSASVYLSGVSNLSLLAGALEIFSDAVDIGASPSVANRFQGPYVSFQHAVAAGDDRAALALAKGELSSLISGIPQGSWPRVRNGINDIAIRTGVLSDPRDAVVRSRELLRSPVLEWRPEIIVSADTPGKRALGRAAVRKAMADALALSVANHMVMGYRWSERALESGLLNAPAVEVEIASYRPRDVAMSVKWERADDGMPRIKIAYLREDLLFSWDLLYAIMRSFFNGSHNWVNLRVPATGDKRHDAPSSVVEHFDRCTSGELRPPWMNAAMRFQSRLLSGNYGEELSRALARLSLDRKAIKDIVAEAGEMRFGISVMDVQSQVGESSKAYVRIVKPSPVLAKSDRRNRPLLHIGLTVPEGVCGHLTEEDLWLLTGRAYALWISYERPEGGFGLSLADDAEGITKPIQRMIYSRGKSSVNLSTNTPPGWSDEFFAIMNLVNSLSRYGDDEALSRHPALRDAVGIIRGMTSTKQFGDGSRFDTIQIVHNKNDSGIRVDCPTTNNVGYGLRITADMDTLSSRFTPMQFAEIVMAVCLSTSSTTRRRIPIDIEEAVKMGQRSGYFKESMAWLKLIWGYAKIVDAERGEQGTLNLLGGGAAPISGNIAQAIERLQLDDPDMVMGSISEHWNWMIEFSEMEDRSKKKETASRMTVAVAPDARLIHFDGVPHLDEDGWMRAVRAIMSAPEGVTWIDIVGTWKSNRPEIIFMDGDEGWYSLNKSYERAGPQGRREYRDALNKIRDLQRSYSEAIGLPLLEPGSSKTAMKRLQSRMLGRFHPDRAMNKDFIDIGEDGVSEFIAAFQVLQNFYK